MNCLLNTLVISGIKEGGTELKIAIDIDNTLCTTTEAVLEYINERTPLNLTVDDIKEYWMENSLPPEYRWIIPESFENRRMWKKVKMIQGAAQGIRELYNRGHEIYFATSTSPENFKKKIKFLKKNLPFLSPEYIENHSISIKEKQLLSVDIMVDDYLNNLNGERIYYSICLDYPWNQTDENIPYFQRVKNWEEVVAAIDLYENLRETT